MSMPENPTTDHFPVAQPSATAENAPASPPGYELREEIGRGGMGTVYLALDVALCRDVAVKLLAERFAPGSPAAIGSSMKRALPGNSSIPASRPCTRSALCPTAGLFWR